MKIEVVLAFAAGRGGGGGDVRAAFKSQEADGQAAERRHDAGRVSRPDQRVVFLVSHVPDPVKAVFDLPVAADPGGEGLGIGVAASDEVDDLDGLPALLRDGAAQPGDLRMLALTVIT
jgi:hypothetical protein